MINIYYSNLSKANHENLMNGELLKFPLDFQEKIKQYRRWQDAQLSLLGRILLIKGCVKIYNQEKINDVLKYTDYGKPYFDDRSIHFNISHSGEITICAFSDASDVGIDIEMISDIEISDFQTQMTENEWNMVISSDNIKLAFVDYWTQKEATIKAIGTGLSIPLNSFEITAGKTEINMDTFYLKEVKIDNRYKCYISTKNKHENINLKQIEINEILN